MPSEVDPYEPFLHRRLLAAGQALVSKPLADPPAVEALDLARQIFDLHLTTPVLASHTAHILRGLLATPLRAALLNWAREAAQEPRGLSRLGPFADDAVVQTALLGWLQIDQTLQRIDSRYWAARVRGTAALV